VKPGVWDIRVLSQDIRILVLSRLPLEQRNAVLTFLSFNAEKVRFAWNTMIGGWKTVPPSLTSY